MLKRFAALLFVACATNGASESDESWKNLGRTIKESDYTVATRDGHCVTGHVESFDEKSVTIKSVRLDRKDVIRVGDGTGTADHDPIYSGRSSWADLQHAEPNKYEHIRLHFKSGVTRNYHTFSASVEQATCDGAPTGKLEVARGYYVRLAPTSEWEHHVLRENISLLAPRLWFNLAFFPRITVLLYDAALPEENFKVACVLTAPTVSPKLPTAARRPARY